MTREIPPIAYTCDEDGRMTPRDPRATEFYEPGNTYPLVPYQGRSQKSHNHEFAVIDEAWKHLPGVYLARFPTPTHFRKFLLITCGYHHLKEIPCGSDEVAAQVAAHLKVKDEYAIIQVQGGVVREFTAESQSKKAMGAKRFQESKTAIFEEAALMIGVDLAELAKNVGKAA